MQIFSFPCAGIGGDWASSQWWHDGWTGGHWECTHRRKEGIGVMGLPVELLWLEVPSPFYSSCATTPCSFLQGTTKFNHRNCLNCTNTRLSRLQSDVRSQKINGYFIFMMVSCTVIVPALVAIPSCLRHIDWLVSFWAVMSAAFTAWGLCSWLIVSTGSDWLWRAW